MVEGATITLPTGHSLPTFLPENTILNQHLNVSDQLKLTLFLVNIYFVLALSLP